MTTILIIIGICVVAAIIAGIVNYRLEKKNEDGARKLLEALQDQEKK